jgi:hypothetical protein
MLALTLARKATVSGSAHSERQVPSVLQVSVPSGWHTQALALAEPKSHWLLAPLPAQSASLRHWPAGSGLGSVVGLDSGPPATPVVAHMLSGSLVLLVALVGLGMVQAPGQPPSSWHILAGRLPRLPEGEVRMADCT